MPRLIKRDDYPFALIHAYTQSLVSRRKAYMYVRIGPKMKELIRTHMTNTRQNRLNWMILFNRRGKKKQIMAYQNVPHRNMTGRDEVCRNNSRKTWLLWRYSFSRPDYQTFSHSLGNISRNDVLLSILSPLSFWFRDAANFSSMYLREI